MRKGFWHPAAPKIPFEEGNEGVALVRLAGDNAQRRTGGVRKQIALPTPVERMSTIQVNIMHNVSERPLKIIAQAIGEESLGRWGRV